MVDEEPLHYMGALVMGLNDAIVEITGAIAGFTIVLQNTTLTALAGLITGVAGSLSIAASEYLGKQTESNKRSPAKAAGYTGGAYLVVAAILVAPYLWFGSFIAALVCMLIFAFVIILFFRSTARSYSIRVQIPLPSNARHEFWSCVRGLRHRLLFFCASPCTSTCECAKYTC